MQNISSIKIYIMFIIITISIIVMLNISPIPQNPEYHNFADQRQLFGIANFWNVVSNLPFIVISYIAVFNLLVKGTLKYLLPLFPCYLVFFIAIGAVGIGSAYYHLEPTNASLFWDRLPMTVGFMAFVSIITGEYISYKFALRLLIPLIVIGISSVIYWYITEQLGHGDLRFYGFVQFVPILIIPMIILLFPARYTHASYFWAMLVAYLIAKIFESLDTHTFHMIGISGHTFKHICAAIGAYIFFLAMKKRMLIGK